MILRLTNRQLFTYGLVIILMGFAIGSVSLTYPFGRDQGIYAYAGKLLLEGKVNYLHVFDLKPPGIHFLYAFAQLVIGESMFNIRLFDIAWQSMTAFVVFVISFKLTKNSLLSLIAAFLTIFLYYRQDYWHTLQADGMLNLFFALSVLLLILSNQSHSFVKVFFAGVFFAIALLFKYTIISFLPLLFILMLLNKGELKSIRIKNVVFYSMGVVLTGLIVISVYYFTGALNELIDLQFVQTPLYTKIAYETESTGFILSHILRLFTTSVYGPLILLSFAGFIILLVKKKLEFNTSLLLCWVISSLFSLIIQWKFYHYHFLVIIPPISIGALLFASVFITQIKKSSKKIITVSLFVIFAGYIAFATKPYLTNYPTLFSFLSGSKTLKEVYTQNGTTTDSVFMMSKTFNAVDFVNQYTNPDDYVYVWGFDPLVYYLSGRKCASRFIYSFPLFWKGENSKFRTEFVNSLNKNIPKLILVANNDPLYFISGYNEDSKQLLERFPGFNKIIAEKYSYKKRVDDFDMYELKTW